MQNWFNLSDEGMVVRQHSVIYQRFVDSHLK